MSAYGGFKALIPRNYMRADYVAAGIQARNAVNAPDSAVRKDFPGKAEIASLLSSF